MISRQELTKAQRIVVKVGTSTLNYDTGKLNISRIEHLVRELSDLANQGKEIILVSSGAVGAGLERMKKTQRPNSIPEKQALAAVGQGILMHIYEKLFAEYDQIVAQVLLTKENSRQYSQYINSRNALMALLSMGVIPIINENDAVAVDELKIGDNDTLSATVATLIDADVLIILSDIDGLYTANPAKDKNAKLISEVKQITPEVEQIAGGAGSSMGTGGMSTKIKAAKIAINSGTTMVIASGSEQNVLRRLLSGEDMGTIFPAKESHLKQRKSWLAFGKQLAGDIVVDEGCEQAVLAGSSLLAVGITHVAGEFQQGNTVRILSKSGREIARGSVNYNADILAKLKGLHSTEFPSVLKNNSPKPDEVIHRDNMVIMV